MQTARESPMAVKGEDGDRIFNAVLEANGLRLMGSDDEPSRGERAGGKDSIFVSFTDAPDERAVYNSLTAGGEVIMGLEDEVSGPGFAMLTDKFDVSWMLARQNS